MRLRSARLLKNQKGAALLLAIFTVMLLIFLSVEIAYETAVEYRVSSADYQRLKAYYAARAGVELSLLRIKLYRQITTQFKEQLKNQPQLADLLWQFPFMWPPKISEDMTSVSKDEIQGTVADSFMDSIYVTQISSEGSKLDINDLASPSKALREGTRKQLLKILQSRLDADDDWARENRGKVIPEEIVNNLQDWVDPDSESRNGGDEKNAYSDLNSDSIPPNQPFKTLEELHMVKGINDEVFALIAPAVTVYGVKGINVNHADKTVLMAIDAQITEKIADEILTRRNDPKIGPFRDEQEFKGYLDSTREVDMNKFNEEKTPLYFDTEYNFRIQSVGQFGNSSREIIAIVYDFDTVKGRLEKLLTTTGSSTTTTTTDPNNPGAAAASTTTTLVPPGEQSKLTGRPQIIYWYEN